MTAIPAAHVNPQRSRRRLLAAAAACLAVAGLPAAAQGTAGGAAYPARPITLIVPNAAGGAADNLARGMAEQLQQRLGQPIVVENLAGASGAIAAQRVLRAAPDGYTLLFGTTSDMVVTPAVNRSAGYAPADFTPIARVGITPMTLVARPGLGAANVDELVALARRKPQGLAIGTTGSASLQALAAIALQKAAGIELLPVAYKGGAPVLNDLLGGQIDLGVLTLPGAMAQVKAGRVTMLGLLTEKRADVAPEVPTVNEGRAVDGVDIQIWAAIAGPPALPDAVVQPLSQAIKSVLEDTAFVERRARSGDVAVPYETPEAFARFLAAEWARYRELAAGVKVE